MTKTKEDILRMIDEAGVRYIRLCFTDILGQIKGMSITRSEIEQVMDEGQGFDGSGRFQVFGGNRKCHTRVRR